MKIQQQEPTFGRLYMPTKMQIQRVFGEELANKADLAREELTELAKNKDIFVSTYLELTEARAIPLFRVKVAQEKAEPLLSRIQSFLIRKNEYVSAESETLVEDLVKSVNYQI